MFALSPDRAFVRVDPEPGEPTVMAGDLEGWARALLDDSPGETGRDLAHRWQLANGPLGRRQRLVPNVPFVLAETARAPDVWVCADGRDAALAYARLSVGLRGKPDGARVDVSDFGWPPDGEVWTEP